MKKVILTIIALCILLASYITTNMQTIKAEVKATDYGAVCDGTNDDTTAIQTALNSANRVLLPSGTCVVTASLPQTYRLFLNTNNSLIGEGNSTIIKCVGGDEHNVLEFTNSNNVTIQDLVVDGNNICGHLLRGGNNNNVTIRDIKAINGKNYGIGFQAGSIQNVLLSNIQIDNVGSDGIDIKNFDNTNKNIFLENITISNFGQINATDSTGIDVRGVANLNNIQVRDLSEEHTGIRFREDSVATGLGGDYSSLANFYIEGNNARYGMYIPADFVNVSNGVIKGNFELGVYSAGTFNSINNVTSIGANTNFFADTNASYTKFSSCVARTGIIGIEVKSDNTSLIGNTISSVSSNGIKITASADYTLVDGNFLKSNGAGPSKLGTNLITGTNFGF